MLKRLWGLVILLLVIIGCGSDPVKLFTVPNSPDFPNAKVRITYPKSGQVISQKDVLVGMTVSNYKLGIQTETDRNDEIASSGKGQHIHLILDKKPYFANYDSSKPFNIGKLPEGDHTLTVFPSRSYHESVKSQSAAHIVKFYIGSKKATPNINLSKPTLIYSRPKGLYKGEDSKKIMLDFYLHNVELSPDGYKVKYTIDGKHSIVLTAWQPAFITGLKNGKHVVELILIDKDNEFVSGFLNRSRREFEIRNNE